MYPEAEKLAVIKVVGKWLQAFKNNNNNFKDLSSASSQDDDDDRFYIQDDDVCIQDEP